MMDMIPVQMLEMLDDQQEFVQNSSAWPRWKPWSVKVKESKQITLWISNCGMDKTGRLGLAKGLDAEGVRFASYGKCLTNAKARRLRGLRTRSGRLRAERQLRQQRRLDAFARRTADPGARDRSMYDT